MNSKKNIKSSITLLACILLMGCGSWPSIVKNSSDINGLDPNITSIRARALADDDIPALSRLKKLNKLFIGMGHKAVESRITDKGLQRLAKLNLPKLQVLDLGYCDNITDKGLVPLAEMKNLKHLSLRVIRNATRDKLIF